MGIISFVKNLKDQVFSNDIYGFNGADNNTSTNKLPVFPYWFFTARIGQPRNINIQEVRDFAKSPWVQMVLNTIKREVSIIPTHISKKDIEDDTNYDKDIEIVEDFFKKVNSDGWNIQDMVNPTITDIGEIDAATWVKVFSKNSYTESDVDLFDDLGNVKGTERSMVLKPFGQRELIELRLADGSTFLKRIDIYRRLEAYYQYSFKNPRTNPIRFDPDEVAYMWMNKKSYSIYGFSPVQAIQQVLEVLIQSTRWNKEFFSNNAIPDGIIGLEGANPESMKKFKESWEKQTKGKAHKLLFHNTKANFAEFMKSARDMEWLEGQKWYFHLAFGVFGLSPAEAGFHEDVNRSTQEGQERVTVRNAIKPYLKIMENVINNNIIPELLQQENPGIKWEFVPTEHAEEQIQFDQNMKEIEANIMTINEYRRSLGRDPVEWGEKPFASSPPPSLETDPSQQPVPKKDDKKPPQKMIPYSTAFEKFMSKVR